MSEFLTVLQAVLPVFCIAGAGFLMRRLNWLTAEADASLLRVTINLLTPCLVFDSIIGSQAMKQMGNLLAAPAAGFGTVAFGFGVCLLARGLTGLREEAGRRSFALATGIYNYGYVPLPLIALLFDRETTAVLLVHNAGVEMALWSLGPLLLSGGALRSTWRQMFNPPFVMILATLLLNLSGAGAHAPEFLRQTTHLLGQCAIPLGLILIGATFADEMHEFHPARGGRVMALACLFRLGLLPIAMLLLARFLPCSVELKRVIVIQSAMPAAVFPVLLSKHYGGDTATALRVVVATSLAGFLTIPLWIRFGMKFVGL